MSGDPEHWQYPSMKERVEAEGRRLTAHLCIHYTSSSGEGTIRTVQVSHVLFGSSETYILGMCELRKEQRVFRASRVSRAYQLSPTSLLAPLPQWLNSHAERPSAQAAFKSPVERISSTHYAVQISSGKIYMSEMTFARAIELLKSDQSLEASTFLKSDLPALSQEFASEIAGLLRAHMAFFSGGPREVSHLPPVSSTTSKNADVEQAGRDDAGEA